MRVGDTISDRYVLESLAGEGGMGTVFRALDRLHGGHVALKVLTSQGRDGEARFLREAGILASLSHPAIVRYLGHGIADRRPYLVMEWLEGEDLHDRLDREPLPPSEAVAVVARAAEAVGEAHRLGVVHRDLKPSNIFLVGGSTSDVRVLDFGVARVAAADKRTRTGAIMGTPWYMAPEQASGSRLDARADVFSLGCVLYECLIGAPPFDADAPLAVMANILLDDAPRLSAALEGVPAALDDLCDAMLAKQPENRPRDGAEVGRALMAFADSWPTDPKPLSRSAPLSLGDAESRVVSVALLRIGPAVADDAFSTQDTLEAGASGAAAASLRDVLRRLDVGVRALLDGSIVLVLETGSAIQQSTKIAHAALVARRTLPGYAIAIATGSAVVAQRIPVGEVVDRAVALLQDGDEDRIRIDAVTASLVGDAFDIRSDERGALLVGELDVEPCSVRTLLGKATPYVGRQRELLVMEAMLEECLDEPVSRVMLVTGDVGTGKSRLRREFLERMVSDDVHVWHGRGDPLAVGGHHGVLAPALRRVCGLRGGEAGEVQRAKIHARIRASVDEPRVVAFLGEMMGVTLDEASEEIAAARRDPVLMGDQIQRAWEDFIAAETRQHPLLIVIDDLQWGDRRSVQLLDAALRHAPNAPLMVLAFARPDVFDHFPEGLWEARQMQQLQLDKLPRKACERLVRHVLDDVDDARATELCDRADGNVFFLEELIRAEAEGRGGKLPDTVVATVQTRLDALETDARRVLRAASVFGRSFWRGGVMALLGGDERAVLVDRWIDALVERELLQDDRGSRFEGERQLSFRHQLVRDAAYAMLTPRDVKLGHQLAGNWLEARGESDCVALAEHHQRGEAHAQAAKALSLAAVLALEAHDFQQAIARADRAIACWRHDSAEHAQAIGELELLQAEAYRWLGQFQESHRAAERARTALAEGSAPWFQAVEELLSAQLRLGRFDDVSAWATRLSESSAVGVEAVSAKLAACCCAARLVFQAGDYAAGDALMVDVDGLIARHGDLSKRSLAEAHRLRGATARHKGDVAGDFAGYAAALAHCEAGDERNGCNARVSLAFAYIELGQYDRAEEELVRALDAAERMGLQSVVTRAQQNLALVHAARGRHGDALLLCREVVEASREQNNHRFEGWTRIDWSRIALDAGDAATAREQAEQAMRLTDVTPPAHAGARAAYARALLASGHVFEARQQAFAAAEVMRELGGIEELESLVRLAWIQCLAATGDGAAARVELEKARDRLRRLAAPLTPEQRVGFLERVADNAKLLELADQARLAPPMVVTGSRTGDCILHE